MTGGTNGATAFRCPERLGMADPTRVRPRKHLSRETTEPMPFGHGFISGLLSAILGIAGFGAVLCLRFPQYLTHAELRRLYSLDYLRAIIHVTLAASFLLGSVSAFLRANKALALTGIGFTLAAALLGGSQVPVEGDVGATRDWHAVIEERHGAGCSWRWGHGGGKHD